MSNKTCPNCDKKLDGLLSSRYLLKVTTSEFINKMSGASKEAYCNDCGIPIVKAYSSKIANEKQTLINDIQSQLNVIPVLTMQNPVNWDYEPIGIVSAQSVTGTGFLSEFSASLSDLFGSQSNALNSKISNGENLCTQKLRFSALLLGGNAIIATDIDYSEVGGSKGMLMVCMAGTAIKVKSWSENFTHTKALIETLSTKALRLNEIIKTIVPSME